MVKTLPTVERSTKIRFGRHAREDQGENTIVLNASNTAVDASNGGAVYVSPVRFDDAYEDKAEIVLMMYNTLTKELTQSGESAQDVIGNQGLQAVTNQGNVTSNSMIFYNNAVAFVTTGNVGISNALASHTLSVGSNLYVDDYGTNVLVVSGGVGITDTTTSTSATTGALKVAGGISTEENLNVGAVTKVLSATDSTSKTTGALIVTGGVGISKNIHGKNVFVEDVVSNSVVILDTTTSSSATTGALKVVGGISTQENLNVGGTTTSTSATTGALQVAGGISTQENLNVGAVAKVLSATDASSKTTGALIVTGGVGISKNIHALNANFEDVEADSVDITDTTLSYNQTTGALKVAGGLGVAGNVHCGNLTLTGNLVVTGNTTVINANNLVVQDPIIELGKGNTSGLDTGILMNNPLTSGNKGNVAVIYDFSTSNLEIGHTLSSANNSPVIMNTSNAIAVNINGTLGVTSTNASSSKTTGAVTIGGGLGVVGALFGAAATLDGVVNLTDDTTSTSATTGALKVVGGISTQENLHIGGVSKVYGTTNATSKTTGALIVAGGIGVSEDIHGKNVFVEDVVSNSVVILDTTTSTTATSGALKVVGGISTQENLNVGAVAKVISATDATSKTTGALIVTGGLGVAKNIHGKNVFVEDVVSNSVVILDTTTSTNATTGALKVAGGISTQKNLNVGSNAHISSNLEVGTANLFVNTLTSNVGIGTKTPSELLDIAAVSGDHDAFIRLRSGSGGSPVTESGIKLTESTRYGWRIAQNANTDSLKIAHQDQNDAINGDNYMVFKSNGNIGIAEADPTSKLQVAGDVNITDTTVSSSKTTGALIVAGGLGVAANIHTSNIYAGYDADETSYIGRSAIGFMGQSDHASFAHVDNNTTTNYAIKQSAAGTTHLNAKSGQNVSFKINNTEKARITSGGDFYVNTNTLYVDASTSRIGLDTDSPDANLHAVGNVYVGSTTDATTTTTGALIVAGGLGIAKKIVGQHASFEDVTATSVTASAMVKGATISGTNVYGTLAGANTAAVTTLTASGMVKGATISGTNVYGTLAGANTAAVTTLTASAMVKGATISGTNVYGTLAGANTAAVTTLTASAMVKGATISGTNVYGTLAGANTAAVTTLTASAMVKGATISGTNVYGTLAGSNAAAITTLNASGVVTLADTTTSTSATTGALKVAGGISTQENLNVGGDLKVDTSILVVNSTTNRVGINKAVPGYTLDVDGDINFTGTFREDGNPFISTPWTIETSPDALSYTAGNVGIGAADPEANLHVTGNAFVSSTTDATTTVTGALIVAGGMGIAKKIVGQHANFEDVEADSVTVTDTTASDGKTAGALIVAGGVGVSGALFGAAATLDGVVTLTDATESTSSTTGALKAAGGVGIAKDVFVGERAYVTGGLITNTGGVGRKTYSYSADLGSGASIANATYVLDFTNHPFHAKVTAMLIESDDEISTMIFDVIGGKLGGGSNSAYVPALGQVSVINTSTMSTRWDHAVATALAGTTVTIKPADACSGVVRFNIFVEYLSHETAGRLTSITNSGSSAGTGDFGY